MAIEVIPPAEPGPKPAADLFVRRSSGLIREFALSDVVVINIVGVNLGIVGALSVATVAGLWPGASMVLLVVIGAIVSLSTVGSYGLLSATMPRAGGDYVFVGRSLSPWLGFLANWMMTWSLFVLLGLFSVGFVTQALAPALAAFGAVAHSHGIINAATKLTDHKGLIIAVALICIVVAAGTALAGDRLVKLSFRVLATVGLVGTLLAIIALLLTSRTAWTGRIDHILTASGGHTIQGMRAIASKHGFSNPAFSVGKTFSALPYAFYAFVGLTYSTYLGGEIQRPQRSQPLGMLIALITTTVLYILLFVGVYATFGWANIHAWAYLSGNDPSGLSFFGGAPLGSYLFGTVSSSPVVAAIIGLSFIAWFYLILLFAVVMAVRNLFAWSMDGLLPRAVSETSGRGTPWVATIIVGVVAIGVVFVAVYSTFITLVVNYTLFYSITFLLAGVAAMVFPYRRRDLMKAAPGIAAKRLGSVPILSIAGFVQTIVFAIIIVEALRNPAFGGPTGHNALFFIVGLLIAGPIVFVIARTIRSRQGYNVDAAWRSLPPD